MYKLKKKYVEVEGFHDEMQIETRNTTALEMY